MLESPHGNRIGSMHSETPTDRPGLRLDKWLWAARFFKTRQLAVAAVSGGKVELNGQRAKPGKEVHPGGLLRIHREGLEWAVRVEQLPTQRRPAAEAVLCYSEDEQSRLRREARIAEQRLLRQTLSLPPQGRPSKRDRRLIQRFTQAE
jgi:ribosome-associated heat shock protein Hsp15